MSNKQQQQQFANVERRTWDIETYEQKAALRKQQLQQQHQLSSNNHHGTTTTTSESASASSATVMMMQQQQQQRPVKEEFQMAPADALGPENSQRAYLQSRKRNTIMKDINERIGTTTIVSVDDAIVNNKKKQKLGDIIDADTTIPDKKGSVNSKNQPTTTTTTSVVAVGFYCEICDCTLKDSMTYLDHVNGRKHQRNLGYSMRVQRYDIDNDGEDVVLNKLHTLQQQQQEQELVKDKETITISSSSSSSSKTTIDYHQMVQQKDEEEQRRIEERQRLRKERRKKYNKGSDNNDDFTKEQHNSNNIHKEEEVPRHDDDAAEEEEEDDDDEPTIDPAMAAMMGFTNFGSGSGKR